LALVGQRLGQHGAIWPEGGRPEWMAGDSRRLPGSRHCGIPGARAAEYLAGRPADSRLRRRPHAARGPLAASRNAWEAVAPTPERLASARAETRNENPRARSARRSPPHEREEFPSP